MQRNAAQATGRLRPLLISIVLLGCVGIGGTAHADEEVYLGEQRIPLMLDGRLSDPAALPPAVSSPQLDASLAQLRRDKNALELRMTLLERQWRGTVPARAMPAVADRAAPMIQKPYTGTFWPFALADEASGLLSSILQWSALAMLIAGALFMLLRRRAPVEQAQVPPVQSAPQQWQDIDFDLSLIGPNELR